MYRHDPRHLRPGSVLGLALDEEEQKVESAARKRDGK
jgi:hypothetical protein